MLSPRPDTWNSGTLYEPYVGRWSRLVAKEFLSWLALPPGGRWVDCGCGTGALTHTVLAETAPARVVGVDITEGYVAYARAQVNDDRVTFHVADVQSLTLDTATFDVAVSGLVLNFVPQAERMIGEMVRVVRPGGTVALYVWDYAGEMQLMRHFWDAAVALDLTATEQDEGRRFPICKPEPLAQLFTAASLQAVATRAIVVPTLFRDFDDYWTPFLSGQGPAPGYVMSLTEERRVALRERIRSTLPIAADGSISLVARVWAVQGTSAPRLG
ncbi:MAG: class I SAM-dependent methyltransferase [Chloroflexota bacterium]|nr:class I SAM-dependent methyltransferase [Chloroflexota bacterium]MDQ6905881.1 class I SAM-dependent methyltransferase [Chloroflexota bacterium]